LKRWWIVAAYALFFVAMNWPVLALANRTEPRVAGLPFLVAWYLFWSFAVAIFHAALLFWRTNDPTTPESADDEEAAQ